MAEPKYKQYILDFRLSDGTTHSIPLKVPFGEPGKDGITPHIGSNGNWFIGEKDTGISAGGSGGYVAQDDPPEDTSVLWIDTDDNSDDGFQEAVNYALAQAKASGEFDGDDYVLTDDDKNEIAELAAGLVEVPDAQNPLTGTTAEISPSQAFVAFVNGQPMMLSHTKDGIDYLFTSFNLVGSLDSYSSIIFSTIVGLSGNLDQPQCDAIMLFGSTEGSTWNVMHQQLPVMADVPTDEYIKSLIEAELKNHPGSGGGISVTGAEVGQTVKISEVDETGKPTAWEPTDFPSGGGSGELEYITSVTVEEDDAVSLEVTLGDEYKAVLITTIGDEYNTSQAVTKKGAVKLFHKNGEQRVTFTNLNSGHNASANRTYSWYVACMGEFWLFTSGQTLSSGGTNPGGTIAFSRRNTSLEIGTGIDNVIIETIGDDTFVKGARLNFYGVRV